MCVICTGNVFKSCVVGLAVSAVSVSIAQPGAGPEGFAGPEGPLPEVPDTLRPVLDAALPHYQRLRDRALAPAV